MKLNICRITYWPVAAMLFLASAGCSPEAQQATPHKIVGGMAILSGATKGFFVTNGRPTYRDWNAGAGNIAIPLNGADAESFVAFQQPKTARALFARDRSHVYMADFYSPREIKDADAESFALISLDGLYAKDKNHAYYLGVPIVGADPDSFEVHMPPFSQDKERAFIGATPIPEIDRASWRPLRKGSAGDPWHRENNNFHPLRPESMFSTGWSRDKNTFYYGTDAITKIDVATFQVLSDYYAKDQHHVYSCHFYRRPASKGSTAGKLMLTADSKPQEPELDIIEGADPVSFVVHKDVDSIISSLQGADAHDSKKQYRQGRIFISN